MAYTITLTDGTTFATIPDGTVNQNSSVTLIGKNYAGYGDFLDENFIQHLENFASTSSGGTPTNSKLANPLTGQLWWDKTNSLLKVYSGAGGWKTISAATSSASAPTSNVTGDLWFDTTNQQLKVWTGAAFLVVGPAYSSSQGTSGAVPETITDDVGSTKYITSLYVNNNRVAIVYNTSSFTPQLSLQTDFPTIYPGITLSQVNSPVFAGTANNSTYLNSLDSSQFMRSDANTATTGRLQVNNTNGLYVGTSNVVNISQSTNDGVITTPVSGGNLLIQANVGGTTYVVARSLGASGTFGVGNALTVGTTISAAGNITGGNINTAGLASIVGNVVAGNVNGGANVFATTHTGTTVSVTANITGGNVRTGGQVSAAGNVTAGSGAFFIGDGGLLSNVSAAVSVSQIQNGTSNVKIGSSGGNVTIGVSGSDVVTIDSTTLYATIANVGSIAKSGSNAVGNIGSSTNYFNRVFATATTALYADVAERFAADEFLEPGTVVELGGVKEITKSRLALSDTVFGVISTQPAYTMNGGAGEDDTHPPVAMTGRVPVKVIGRINKGDRLVSAGNGVARSATAGEATAFNVIGRALEAKTTDELGTIEAIVTIK